MISNYTISLAQQSLKETIGFYNGRENIIPDFETINGFDLDGLTYSGTGMQGATKLSQNSGYAGASGYPDVYMTASQTFIAKGLTPSSPCNTANTTISLGWSVISSSTSITVSYSSDNGTTWFASSPTPVTNSWQLQSVLVPGNTNAGHTGETGPPLRANYRITTCVSLAALNELLLKEIHYLIKNNLAVVSGLLALQSAKDTDPNVQEAIQASQSRVQSMGIIHQKLYQGD